MEKLYEKFENDANSKYLDTLNNFKPIALSIYPNLDNYMIRYLLECVIGIVVGSDQDPESFEGKATKEKGFAGEGVIDSKVWIKQTRYPESKGLAEFDVHKCILVCKNMFSLIWSLFEKEIRETNTTLSMQEILQNEQLLSKFIHNEGEIIHEYFSFWLNVPIPLFVLRIEDLIFNPEETLSKLLSFLLGIENIKGSVIENRMITFLKYNKAYTNFLEESLNQEEVVSNFSTFQKILMLKIFQDELVKFGYVNPRYISSISFKKTIEEEELKAIFDVLESDNCWYRENNRKYIKQNQETQNKNEKYVISTLLKLNNLDPLRAAYT